MRVTSRRSLPRRLSPNGSNFLCFGPSRNVRSESTSQRVTETFFRTPSFRPNSFPRPAQTVAPNLPTEILAANYASLAGRWFSPLPHICKSRRCGGLFGDSGEVSREIGTRWRAVNSNSQATLWAKIHSYQNRLPCG
jgi:hypothetical protein